MSMSSATRSSRQLSLDASPPVPADVVAEIRSVSAVGEQYVDLIHEPRRRRTWATAR